MSEKQYRDFIYIKKDDYDKRIKVNGDDLSVYSGKKLKELYPDKNYKILGETFENKRRDKKGDIGRIDLNEKRLNIGERGKHSRLFKKEWAYTEVNGGFIAILKTRILTFIILGLLITGMITGGIIAFCQSPEPKIDPNKNDPNIKPAPSDILTVSGTVTIDGKGMQDIFLSLCVGEIEVASATTDKDGKYLFAKVENGNYNLICSYGNSKQSKLVVMNNISITVDFDFSSRSDVKAIVKSTGENTPPIAVGGLTEEAMSYAEDGKEVDITLFATKMDSTAVSETDRNEIGCISGELDMVFYCFTVLKEIFRNSILENSEYLKKTNSVLEIALPHDSSTAVGTYVFRCHDNEAMRFEELKSKPASDYKDGTYFVTADTVYIYTNCFSTYAVGSAYTDKTVRGNDVITYNDEVTVNLKTSSINMYYKHDNKSTNDARIEIYLVGENENLLISQSGKIPVGYELDTMTLIQNIEGMPSVGVYRGLMRIIYLGAEGSQTSTNVEIPLTVMITR